MSEEKEGCLVNLGKGVMWILFFVVVLPCIIMVAANLDILLDILLLILVPIGCFIIAVIVIGGIVKAGYVLHRMDNEDVDSPDKDK